MAGVFAAKVATKIERGVCIIARSRSSVVNGLYERAAPDLSKILKFFEPGTAYQPGIRTKPIFVERSGHFLTY